MKYFIIKNLLLLALTIIFISCASQSWMIPEKSEKDKRITLNILDVQVDRSGGWDSIKKEASNLTPLYFWNNRCRAVTAEEKPVYAAIIYLSERELHFGFRTKKSLSVDVRIWEYDKAPKNGELIHEQKLPAAIGRYVYIGKKSFSSTVTIEKFLEKAVSQASFKLAVYDRRKR